MGRIGSLRSNYDDLQKISLVDLKRMNLLIGYASTDVSWTRNGVETGAISVVVKLDYSLITGDCESTGYVELSYVINDNHIRYRINLIRVASNLGTRGGIWYFTCPVTQKRCRTLYLDGEYFVSRYAIEGRLYKSQTYSRPYRMIVNRYGPVYKRKEALEQLTKPYAKSHYRNKPTPIARKALMWQHPYWDEAAKTLEKLEEYLFGM